MFTVAGLDQSNRKVHYAHRSVLAAASAYFNAMFTSDVLEAKRERIVIQSLDGLTLASLLDFMYTGKHEEYSLGHMIQKLPYQWLETQVFW